MECSHLHLDMHNRKHQLLGNAVVQPADGYHMCNIHAIICVQLSLIMFITKKLSMNDNEQRN